MKTLKKPATNSFTTLFFRKCRSFAVNGNRIIVAIKKRKNPIVNGGTLVNDHLNTGGADPQMILAIRMAIIAVCFLDRLKGIMIEKTGNDYKPGSNLILE